MSVYSWRGVEFQSSCSKTSQFSSFSRAFRAEIKKQIQSFADVVSFNTGHFYCSGFIKNRTTGKLGYFSISDVRFSPDRWSSEVLVRTAQHEKDYTGGSNNYTELQSFGQKMLQITQ